MHAEFFPADLSPAWVRGLQLLDRYVLLPLLGIRVDARPADVERLRQLPSNASIVLASNHPSFADPLVLYEMVRRWGRMGYFVAARALFSRFLGLQGSLMRKAGAFSVHPGANNREAVDYARARLREGQHPLIIFPEGHTFYLNDVILPLKPGVSNWAVEMAQEGRASFVVPLAIKYFYRHDITRVLDRAVSGMEKTVLRDAPDVPPGDFWSRLYLRIYRIGDIMLSRQEEHYDFSPPRGADVDERVTLLSEFLIVDLERKYGVVPSHPSLFDRARHLMAILEEDTNHEHAADAAEARYAWALSTFYAGYLRPDSSPERFAETVMKLNRELFDHIPVGLPLRRLAVVRCGPTLDAARYLDAGGQTRLLSDLSHTLQTLVDDMSAP